MTVREYLGQAYRLENRIRMHRDVIEQMKELRGSVSSPSFEQSYNASRNNDAPFEKLLFRIMEMEQKEAKMLEQLLAFKEELIGVINTVEDKDERIVLYQRYINNRTWVQIGEELGWDERTIRRWHNKALSHVTMPENPMKII